MAARRIKKGNGDGTGAGVLELPLAGRRLTVAGLFAGIGGLERGLHMAGHRTALLCEIDVPAVRVLKHHFPGVKVHDDIRTLDALPAEADLIVGGFPCQDLSQAGRTAGIKGERSGLVDQVFRLLRQAQPRWLLLENVSFMLSLDGGSAMRHLTRELESMGFRWAYRVVDTRAFGLPQRRQRVLMLASRTKDPRSVLFADDVRAPDELDSKGRPCGFYWTEGLKGLGWAVDAVPTLKGGSTLGIPSAPAIWMPDGLIGTPDIRDAERMQGFPADWTAPAVDDATRRNGPRWKLVGNAVSVPLAEWVGNRLREPGNYFAANDRPLKPSERWPRAAWGGGGEAFVAAVSEWPVRRPAVGLSKFLQHPLTPLSARATEGFLKRARASRLRFEEGFLDAVAAHLDRMRREASTNARERTTA